METEYVNPFESSLDKSKLYHLTSGTPISADIATDILNFSERGTELATKFMNERIKTNEGNFQDPIRRNRLRLFKDSSKKIMSKKDNTVKTIEANRTILGTLLACSFKLQKIVDFEKACFPLSPAPLSLANPDGSLRKTTKSQLNKILIANYDFKKPPPDKGSVKCYIIDTIAANRCIATVPETYEDLAWSLIKMVPKNYPPVDIIADTYRNSSLKNQEGNRREISEKVMIPSSKSKIPLDFTIFLANNENINNMILTIFKVYEDNSAKTLNALKTNELILSGDEQCFKITLSGVYAMDE